MELATLFEEYRGDTLECVHNGMVAVVDESGMIQSCGDTQWYCFFRSCSKPIQSLPLIQRGIDKKYGLTEEETAMFSASHYGDPYHIALLESILQKTGLREEQLIMRAIYPDRESERMRLLRENLPPRKLFHCCSGKHLGMLLLSREMGEDLENYWKVNSRVQQEILEVISKMTDIPVYRIKIAVDGCGVPVYAVPFHSIATAFLRLQCPSLVEDEILREAVMRNVAMIHRYPNTIAGENVVCSIMASDPDVLGKSGAAGVYALGIQSRRIGVVSKVMDGSHDEFGSIVRHICERLNYETDATRRLAECYSDIIYNSNGDPIGERRAVFDLKPTGRGEE